MEDLEYMSRMQSNKRQISNDKKVKTKLAIPKYLSNNYNHTFGIKSSQNDASDSPTYTDNLTPLINH